MPDGTDHTDHTVGLAARIEAATPPHRDRSVDVLRAIAIAGVILGHWLVTALVADGAGRLRVTSPLSSLPMFTPISWVLQTLALFFLVGGYAAARSHRTAESYGAWVRARMARLLRPLPVLLLGWIPLAAALSLAGFDPGTLERLGRLVLSPLWFLLVYAVLTALAPAVVALCDRLGGYGVAIPIATTALVDLGRFVLGGPAWLGWINVLAGWLVPFYLGVAWATGALAARRDGPAAQRDRGRRAVEAPGIDRRIAAGLFAGGAVATVALVRYAGYPASMVGVPGAAISNLNPPTLAAVAFGITQVGLALLLRDRLARWTRRPRAWTGVALVNLSAMTLFLWHQTAMMLVTVAGLRLGVLPGLQTAPDHPAWIVDRLLWLPIFAFVLAGCLALFHRFERSGPPRPAAARPAARPGARPAARPEERSRVLPRVRGGSRRPGRRRSSC
jgi:acyltransferase-like protein